jgi:hypothetical protein
MKILKLTAENVKKLVAVEITPAGNVVQITGANGSGKSSVLDAIFWALAGTAGVDAVPVRTGAQKARIRLDLGDLIVTRRFIAESGGTSLVVENAEGARYPSPQAMLDALLGSLTFDPLAFSRMNTREQMDAVKRLVPLDVDLDAADAAIAEQEEKRKRAAKILKEKTIERDAIILDETLSTDPVDVEALLIAHQKAVAEESAIATDERNVARFTEEITDVVERAARLRAEAEELDRHILALSDRRAVLDHRIVFYRDSPRRSSTEILADVASAEKVNANAKAKDALDDATIAIEVAAQMEKDAKETIYTFRAEKAAAIARAPMPIEGLAFGEDGLIYGGVPLSQASSAEQLRVSVAIAMKLNPKLRVLRIKDGSLLDPTSLALVAEMADAEDYQVWIERVDVSGTVGVVMSDGHVVEPEGAP